MELINFPTHLDPIQQKHTESIDLSFIQSLATNTRELDYFMYKNLT